MICHVLLILFTLLISGIRTDDEDAYLTTLQLIQKSGYPAENHTVTTEDGYILEMHRIPYSPKSPTVGNKPVVFLQHGILGSSAGWIIQGPEKSLGYLLADNGFDIWMGNTRGNTYSNKHQTLSTSSFAYWNFSFQEMGIYDLPAEIDYILNKTGQNDSFYVGHSLGTTMFYVLESEKPEYSSKVRYMISLAPIAYMEHVTSLPAVLGSYFPGSQFILEGSQYLGVGELLPSNNNSKAVTGEFCTAQSPVQDLCLAFMFSLFGYDPDQINKTIVPDILGHFPAGTSTKTVEHLVQEIKTIPHNFYKFNYYEDNKVHYGSFNPPIYNLTSIRTPITLMYCNNDLLADPTDVLKLSKVLPNVKEVYEVTLKTCSHLDFLLAIDVKTLVNDEVLQFLNENTD